MRNLAKGSTQSVYLLRSRAAYQPATTRKTGFLGTSGGPLITRSLASTSS
jgi:hypothetical protein